MFVKQKTCRYVYYAYFYWNLKYSNPCVLSKQWSAAVVASTAAPTFGEKTITNEPTP